MRKSREDGGVQVGVNDSATSPSSIALQHFADFAAAEATFCEGYSVISPKPQVVQPLALTWQRNASLRRRLWLASASSACLRLRAMSSHCRWRIQSRLRLLCCTLLQSASGCLRQNDDAVLQSSSCSALQLLPWLLLSSRRRFAGDQSWRWWWTFRGFVSLVLWMRYL